MQIEKEKLDKALEQAEQGHWDKANEILGGFGIEYVSCAGCELKYINLGGTYDQTICCEITELNCYSIDQHKQTPFIGSWGQWYEDTEQEYCEVENVIRCGYCGEFTPMNKADWQDVVCESCGNLVGG
jgi:hypothetical protein